MAVNKDGLGKQAVGSKLAGTTCCPRTFGGLSPFSLFRLIRGVQAMTVVPASHLSRADLHKASVRKLWRISSKVRVIIEAAPV